MASKSKKEKGASKKAPAPKPAGSKTRAQVSGSAKSAKTAKKPAASVAAEPKIKAVKAKKTAVEKAPAPKARRVEVIKKVDVLKRMAEEAAKETALKEALEKEAAVRETALKEVARKPAIEGFTLSPPPTGVPKEQIKEKLAPPEPVPETKPTAEKPSESPGKEPLLLPGLELPAADPQKKESHAEKSKGRAAPPVKTREPQEIPLKETHKPKTKEPIDVTQEAALSPSLTAAGGPLPKIKVSFPVTLSELAPKLNKTPNEFIKLLMQKGMMVTINQRLEEEAAKKIALDFGFELEVVDPLELQAQEKEVDDPSKLKPRPPVVTVMGHVDHGKTSLLDAIRKANVMASEEGGITQRIGAYQVELSGRKITFLDTPGHEAFTAMRARGTKITDVAVLVVAADDGVMPQTLEAIDHAKAATVPIVVAINKIDKPNANVDRVKQQLSDHGLIPEEWGGSTVFVPVSAKQKSGIEELLEMILLVADLAELKANPEKFARGTIIEAKLDRGKGPVATALVQEGTFRVGDAFVAGNTYGRVRAFINDRSERIEAAPPSSPVEIIGLNEVPEAGDLLQVVADDKVARQIAEARLLHARERTLASLKRVTLDDLYQQIKEGEIKDLNLILKADGQGSVEALKDSLERLTTDEIRVRVIHTGVGTITESDVMLASASNAIIIGYNIRPEPHIKNLAEREKVDLRIYRVIYQAIEDITQAMVGMRKPMMQESLLGRAEVLQAFKIRKVGTIAGCRITDGKITREAEIRIIRDSSVVYEGKIASLKRFKDDAREVTSGFECGIGIEKFNDVKVGDVFEAYVIEEIRHTTLAGKSEG